MSDITPVPSTSSLTSAGAVLDGVKLTHNEYCDVDLKQCIICQKHDRKSRVSSTPNGREKIKHAGTVRQDVVAKRLRTIDDQSYVYHVDTCYKVYTMKKTIEAISRKATTEGMREVVEMEVDQGDECRPPMSLRSETHVRSKPSSNIHSNYIPCVICGNLSLTIKGLKSREKFRICERERAKLFLLATHHNCDDVFDRVSDVNSVEAVFAADLYCHKQCINKYILNYQRSSEEASEDSHIVAPKHALFQEAVKQIDPLLEKDYGFTVSEIASFMVSLNTGDDDLNIRNRDVKQLLIDHYGDRIQFVKNPRRNASEMVYSSHVRQEDLIVKIKNLDIMRQSGTLLRGLIQKVNFGLGDRFCDSEEIKESWEKTQMPDGLLTFFSSLFNIPKARMTRIQALMHDYDEEECPNDSDEEDNDDEADKSVKTLHTQLHCLFQIITYHIHKGRQKTPMHAMVGQSVYGKTRSRALITTLNRIGVSTSYNEVRRARSLLSSYAVLKSEADGTPIPSHFNSSDFCIGAMDNSDYSDESSLSGTHSKHYTAMVLFQEKVSAPAAKPNVSSTGLTKSSIPTGQKLPCQIVPHHAKSVVRPSLSPDFVLRENSNLGLCDPDQAAKDSDKTEFVITLVRSELPNLTASLPGDLPTWGSIHALVSEANVPLMRVGFLPMIPKPVTDYATVRKALTNFQSVRQQLNQSILPVFSDEGVFQVVTEVVLTEPDTFADIYPMMGMFHYCKVLLRCAGRLLTGTGFDDGLIEAEVFGKKVLQSVLAGSHYVRAFKGMLIVGEVLNLLKWRAFWEMNSDDSHTPFVHSVGDLKDSLSDHNIPPDLVDKFQSVVSSSDNLRVKLEAFTAECEAKSELCKYLGLFENILSVIKKMITADREGNWPLHIATVRESMKMFTVFDCINYLRYASWYLERIEVMEVEQPMLFRRFMMGQFVIQDREGGKFSAVSPDMKLEQTINRSEKGPGGHVIVGSSGDASIVAEFELLFHEITGITNLFNHLTNAGLMAHLDATVIHHELRGRKAIVFDENVSRLLDFISQRQNPFAVTTINVSLHNIVTHQLVATEVKARLLRAFEIGEQIYQGYRNERFVLKTVKLSGTISKVKLPRFDTQPAAGQYPTGKPKKPVVTTKQLAASVRTVEIAKQRGYTVEQVVSHDLFDTSPLFDGDATFPRCTKPEKSKLVAELEKHLLPTDSVFNPSHMKTDVVLDFMSKIRQYPNLSIFQHFGQAIETVLNYARSICHSECTHLVFDSYCELSVKEGERGRRAEEAGGTIDVVAMTESVPIPQQMGKFWASSKNKESLQILTRNIALRDHSNIVVSGMVVDNEVMNAQFQAEPGSAVDVPTCSSCQEEADCRLISHIAWSVERGCDRVVVISNDTDSIALILRYMTVFKTKGLKELWIEYGTGEHRRKIPLHTLHTRLGADTCSILIKAHVLSGDDAVSKVGTKHAALVCQPMSLTNFAETNSLTEADIRVVEQYLVRLWAGARSSTTVDTFDTLRYDCYLKGKSLNELPPTSSAICGHVRRCFFVIRNAITLLQPNHDSLDPKDFGWTNESGVLVPERFLYPLPPNILVLCQCTGKCDRRCKCRSNDSNCVHFCHKGNEQCVNKH